ncbi:MAG: DnaD domain protein [Clostridia bacterium]|nr:DnaD domain protein [Clostridia bacterium]
MIKNENYIVIQGFMTNDLKLKGNELIIYAIIYGFSQTPGQKYNGSLQYLMNWTNSSKQGVLKNLKSLLDKGFVEKEEKYINNIKYCEYSSKSLTEVVNKVDHQSTKFNEGGQQSLPNNIYNINKKEEEKEKIINFYNNNFGLITPYVAENIFTYLNDGLDEDLIIKAMEESIANNVRRWNYVKTILNDCINNNIKTAEEYEAKQREYKNQKTNKETNTTKKKEITYNTDFSEYDKYVKRN